MSLACDSCERIIRGDDLITVQTMIEKPHPAFGHPVTVVQEKTFCSPSCVSIEMIALGASRALGETRAE